MFVTRLCKLYAGLGVLLIVAVACTSAPPTLLREHINLTPLTPTKTPVPGSNEEAIRQLINHECDAVVRQDVDRLEELWLPDGVVTDANHTKADPQDDASWRNWDAIRDRYLNIVFPSNPTFCEHPDVQITFNGNSATATSSVKIGITNCKDCNLWTFTKDISGWRIASLTYNLYPE